MPAAWIPWKSENALWHECNLPLTVSVQCSLICLLPVYFQPHWKCLKVSLDNTRKPKCAELLEDDQIGQQKKIMHLSVQKGLDKIAFCQSWLAVSDLMMFSLHGFMCTYWGFIFATSLLLNITLHVNSDMKIYFERWYLDWYFLELSYCRRVKGRRIMMKQKRSYSFYVGSCEEEMLIQEEKKEKKI